MKCNALLAQYGTTNVNVKKVISDFEPRTPRKSRPPDVDTRNVETLARPMCSHPLVTGRDCGDAEEARGG
jgi:hypothetical protein|tara:strand:- start:78 stop:287 length:210 start_codon:yes stop_codon:yes gene_type:complete